MKIESLMIVLILACIFLSGCTKTPTPESDENKIITLFTEHQMSIKDYSGTVSLKTDDRNSVSERYKIYVKYPDRYKVEYLESSSRHTGTVSILEAGEFLEYDPVNNATITAEINPEGNAATNRDYLGLLNRIIPMGNTSYAGVAYIENKPVYLIEISPEKPGDAFNLKYSEYRFSLARAWVDPESWIVKRIELFDSERSHRIVSVNYGELLMNSGLSDTVFDPRPYLQYGTITPPTHPPVVMYPGVEYPTTDQYVNVSPDTNNGRYTTTSHETYP